MPKKNKADLTYREKAEHFLRKYVTKGKLAEYIPWCERQAGLKPGEGEKILGRDWAIQKLQALDGPIRAEQITQAAVSQSVDRSFQLLEQRLADQYKELKAYKLDPEVLAGRLMQMAMTLSPHMWAKEIHEIVKTLMVVHGSMQVGNTKRIIPADEVQENPAALIYTPLFERMRSGVTEPENLPESKPEAKDEGVYDLYPSVTPKPARIALPALLPPPGESIDEPEDKKPENPNIITVEVS